MVKRETRHRLPRCANTMTCPVCCDAYTKETRKTIPCLSCGYEACGRCVKAFLLSTPTEPNCMNCHHVWNREFLDQHLSRAWREGELKLHRATLLFDRERSLLPATQEAVTVELQKRGYAKELQELSAEVAVLQEKISTLMTTITERRRYIMHGPVQATEVKERRQFIAACPREDCRGFLSTAYKCGTCQEQFCAACRELKGEGHVCDPALVETMAAIAKDCRPCPNCGMGISKVSGCDQMYCTSCDTAYSYQTGKVVTGVIHNPHYFERMRQLKGAVPRQPGDECNGWPGYPQRLVSNAVLRGLYRIARHTEQVSLPAFPTEAVPTNNTDLRVRFLLKELDEKRFKQLVQQRDRKRQRDLEIRAPLELFVLITMEFFQKPKHITEATIKQYTEQIETMVNAPLRDIGERYGNRVPLIDIAAGEFSRA